MSPRSIRLLKMTAIAGFPFASIMGMFFTSRSNFSVGMTAGLLSGVIFGVLMAVFAEWQRSRLTITDAQMPGETILHQGPANLLRGAQGIGGWLALTDHRLLFRSHRFNAQTPTLSIALAKISDARVAESYKIIPNGLVLEADGTSLQFVVEGRQAWVNAIQRAIEELPRPAEASA